MKCARSSYTALYATILFLLRHRELIEAWSSPFAPSRKLSPATALTHPSSVFDAAKDLEQSALSSPRRRHLLSVIPQPLVAAASLGLTPQSASAGSRASADEQKSESIFRSAYQVLPDASPSLSPRLREISTNASADMLIRALAPDNGGTLWLGEHHNSLPDHRIQARLIGMIYQQRSKSSKSSATVPPVAIGLEQVQRQFQPVLDQYVRGEITTEQMKERVQWERRWQWPFEGYQPIFELAQTKNIPLVALNVNSEDLALVEHGGLPGLPKDILRSYIVDPKGFAAFAQPNDFRTYVDYVIRPSYELHEAMGILKYTISGEVLPENMSFRNFLSGRLLWDETMASTAYRWTQEHPGSLLVGLVGADHVKFRKGIPGRYDRLASMSGVHNSCVSVVLNPTLIDSRPSGSLDMGDQRSFASDRPDKITLQLRYLKDEIDESLRSDIAASTGGVLPLADYILVGGQSSDA